MKLSSVYFERNVPIGTGDRIDELHLAGDPYQPRLGWSALVRNEDGSITATKNGRIVTLDGYAYTYEAVSDSAAEARVLPPKPVSSAESGAAVDQGLAGDAGSTPARLAKRQRKQEQVT
jgi:hypothetical protein